MNYFKNNNNEIFAYDDEQVSQGYGEDLTELESPIWNGSILAAHKNISQVETKEDGTPYTYYNEDGTPDLVKEEDKIYNDKWNLVSEYLKNDIPNISNTINGGEVHEFIVKGNNIDSIKNILISPSSQDTIYEWVQLGIPTFQTTKAELSIVLIEWEKLQQAKINEVFGIGE
jgi:hypothetical protein